MTDRAVQRNKGQTSSKKKPKKTLTDRIEGVSTAFGEANILTKGIVPATRGGKNLAKAKMSLRGTGRKDSSPWEKKGQGT